MKQIDGEEEYALTWGGLTDTSSELDNLTCESKLNSQKSADVIVPILSRKEYKIKEFFSSFENTYNH